MSSSSPAAADLRGRRRGLLEWKIASKDLNPCDKDRVRRYHDAIGAKFHNDPDPTRKDDAYVRGAAIRGAASHRFPNSQLARAEAPPEELPRAVGAGFTAGAPRRSGHGGSRARVVRGV